MHKIKEVGGITFAQPPETAQQSDMQKNAVETGYIDYILTPKEVAREIFRIAGINNK